MATAGLCGECFTKRSVAGDSDSMNIHNRSLIMYKMAADDWIAGNNASLEVLQPKIGVF